MKRVTADIKQGCLPASHSLSFIFHPIITSHNSIQTSASCALTGLSQTRQCDSLIPVLLGHHLLEPTWHLHIHNSKLLGTSYLGHQQNMAGHKCFFLLILSWQKWNAFYTTPQKVPGQWAPDMQVAVNSTTHPYTGFLSLPHSTLPLSFTPIPWYQVLLFFFLIEV